MNTNDEKNHHLFKFYGTKCKEYRQKCIGLLPAIYKSGIYKQKGFESIFEYAAKLAGLSNEVVRRVLSLEERFEETPLLKDLLIEGKVSIHKLARVASVATAENQEFLAEQVQILPQKAIETLIRDEKNFVRAHKIEIENKIKTTQLPMESALQLSPEIEAKLLDLQKKGIDINKLLLELLEKHELEIAQEKEKIAATQHDRPSRYIPVGVKKILQKEHGTKCSIKACNKPSQEIHHTQRFSLSNMHDPHYMAPLCKEHHTIAHSIDLKVQKYRTYKLLLPATHFE